MKKATVFTILFICSFSYVFSASPTILEGGDGKVVLPCYNVKDSLIRVMANNLSNYIMRKKTGFQWPVTKIIFSKDGDKVQMDVTAIDNSWTKLFEAGEKPFGYFVSQNRMFIVSTNESSNIDLMQYFEKDEDGERTFFKSEIIPMYPIKNPKWIYHYKDRNTALVLFKSLNLQSLGK